MPCYKSGGAGFNPQHSSGVFVSKSEHALQNTISFTGFAKPAGLTMGISKNKETPSSSAEKMESTLLQAIPPPLPRCQTHYTI